MILLVTVPHNQQTKSEGRTEAYASCHEGTFGVAAPIAAPRTMSGIVGSRSPQYVYANIRLVGASGLMYVKKSLAMPAYGTMKPAMSPPNESMAGAVAGSVGT